MPSAAEVAKEILAARVERPNGSPDRPTVGELLSWIDQHAAQLVDEQCGPGAREIRGPIVDPPRWVELGNRTQVEALQALLDHAGIEPKAAK